MCLVSLVIARPEATVEYPTYREAGKAKAFGCQQPACLLLPRTFILPRIPNGHREAGCNRDVPGPAEDLASGQEPILFQVDRVRLHFHNKFASQGKNSLQPIRRLEGCQREQEICETVASAQPAVLEFAIETISPVLLSALKRKVSS